MQIVGFQMCLASFNIFFSFHELVSSSRHLRLLQNAPLGSIRHGPGLACFCSKWQQVSNQSGGGFETHSFDTWWCHCQLNLTTFCTVQRMAHIILKSREKDLYLLSFVQLYLRLIVMRKEGKVQCLILAVVLFAAWLSTCRFAKPPVVTTRKNKKRKERGKQGSSPGARPLNMSKKIRDIQNEMTLTLWRLRKEDRGIVATSQHCFHGQPAWQAMPMAMWGAQCSLQHVSSLPSKECWSIENIWHFLDVGKVVKCSKTLNWQDAADAAVLLVFGERKEYARQRIMPCHLYHCFFAFFFGKKTGGSMPILGSPRGRGETMSRHLGFGSQTGVSQRHLILI